MQQHVLQHDLGRVLHAQRNHSKAVTDEDHLHADMLSNMCAGEVVRRHHCNRLFLPVHGHQRGDGDLGP